jgi:tetratricopeptide (TPR) repeat protein
MPPSLRASLLFRYAQFLTIFGLRARAHEFIELALQQNPRHQRAWTFSAFLNAEKGRFDAAITDFEHAVLLKPDDADSVFNLGFALQRVGRHPEAMDRFQRVLELNKFQDRAWYGMGISLFKLGRYEQAAENFAEAARLQPMNPYAAYQLASAWSQLSATRCRRSTSASGGSTPRSPLRWSGISARAGLRPASPPSCGRAAARSPRPPRRTLPE